MVLGWVRLVLCDNDVACDFHMSKLTCGEGKRMWKSGGSADLASARTRGSEDVVGCGTLVLFDLR